MEKSVQSMTLQELRDEHDRTRPAWAGLADVDDVLDDDELPALSEDARLHELVLNELLRDQTSVDLHRVLGAPCGDCCLPWSVLSSAPLTVPAWDS